jgi:Uma2 family endonuclease
VEWLDRLAPLGGTRIAGAESSTGSPLPLQPNGSEWPVPPESGCTLDDLYTPDLPPHTQLIDGMLVFAGPQQNFHTVAMYLLERGLRSTAPEDFRVRRQMSVVLSPNTVPEPDLIVLTAEADGDQEQTRYKAEDVVLAVEVVSPDSEARDRDTKPHKYAAAGIPHFWRVEMAGEDDHPAVYVYELDAGTKTYALTGVHREQLKVEVPYPVAIDLTEIDRL